MDLNDIFRCTEERLEREKLSQLLAQKKRQQLQLQEQLRMQVEQQAEMHLRLTRTFLVDISIRSRKPRQETKRVKGALHELAELISRSDDRNADD